MKGLKKIWMPVLLLGLIPFLLGAATLPPSYAQFISSLKTPVDLSQWLQTAIRFQDDQNLFGMDDYWQKPEDFFKSLTGDCEDYALFSQAALTQMGYAASVISIYGKGYAHTVVIFKDGNRFFIMDDGVLKETSHTAIKEIISEINPDWLWAARAERRGTRGWLTEEFVNTNRLN